MVKMNNNTISLLQKNLQVTEKYTPKEGMKRLFHDNKKMETA